MTKKPFFLLAIGLLLAGHAFSSPDSTGLPAKDHNLLLEYPGLNYVRNTLLFDINKKHILSSDSIPFKPSIQVGAIVHMFASVQQDGFGNPGTAAPTSWSRGFTLYRARVLVGGQLSKKGSFFMETELPSAIGGPNPDGTKNVKVSPIILDAQYQYNFCDAFHIGKGFYFDSQQLHLKNLARKMNGIRGMKERAELLGGTFTISAEPGRGSIIELEIPL